MYATIEAFIPEDLEEMDKKLWALKDRQQSAEGKDDDAQERMEEQMQWLEGVVSEYRGTWYVTDGLLVMQERDMLYVAYRQRINEVERAVSDWEESKDWDEWQQCGGDTSAALEGAVFCKPTKYGYEFVEIIPLYDDRRKGDSHYWVEEHYVDRSRLEGEAAESAKRSWGMGPDEEWTNQRIAEAMREYGGFSSGCPYGADSLQEAMDRFDIPKYALWNPDQYDVTIEEDEE